MFRRHGLHRSGGIRLRRPLRPARHRAGHRPDHGDPDVHDQPGDAYRVDDQVGILAPGERRRGAGQGPDQLSGRQRDRRWQGRCPEEACSRRSSGRLSGFFPEHDAPVTPIHRGRYLPHRARRSRRRVPRHAHPALSDRIGRDAVLPVRRAGPARPGAGCDLRFRDRPALGRGQTASAFVGGFGLKRGAMATSLSPDDDNVICVGASVPDMVVAINHLFDIGGGQVVACDGPSPTSWLCPWRGSWPTSPWLRWPPRSASWTRRSGPWCEPAAAALLHAPVPVNHRDTGILADRPGLRGVHHAVLRQPRAVLDLRRLDRTSSGVGRRTDLMVAILPDVCLLIHPMTTPVASDRLHSFESSDGDCS